MNEQLRDLHAEALYHARREGYTLTPLTRRWPAISIEDAYHISRRLVERRVADGQAIVGKKIGVTSDVVQQMLGVHQPDFGFLTQDM
ncbi:2-oxopent-4-enoate hydratase, partial [Bowmanella sp. Y57]|nr:2-oxopent-4-enoate hydratase [Bowmanella yangjiangensis]